MKLTKRQLVSELVTRIANNDQTRVPSKYVPPEMELAPRYVLLTLITPFTLFTLFTLFKMIYTA